MATLEKISKDEHERMILALKEIIDDKNFNHEFDRREKDQLTGEMIDLQQDYKKNYGDFYKPKDLNTRQSTV